MDDTKSNNVVVTHVRNNRLGWTIFATLIAIFAMFVWPGWMNSSVETDASATPQVLVVVVTATPDAQPTPEAWTYPLADAEYDGWTNGRVNNDYDAIWNNDGWLHQPNLPTASERTWHAVSISLTSGRYEFNGVSCTLFIDPDNDGLGSDGQRVAHHGNGIEFSINTNNSNGMWALVECDDTEVTGFSIMYLGR